jgi:MFS family permease
MPASPSFDLMPASEKAVSDLNNGFGGTTYTDTFQKADYLDPAREQTPENGLHQVKSLTQSIREDVQNTDGVMSAVLGRSVTGRSGASKKDPPPPPDGGLLAWLQALAGHLVIFNTWGFVASFGVFQTYYTTNLGHPPSDISWVGSVQIFLLFFIGTFSGRALDAGYFHHVFVTGWVLQLVGVFMTSLATKYYQLFLAQGLLIGIANGLQFCPTMSLVSTWFSSKRTFAMGIAATGSATGGLVFPALARELLPKIGFPWTVRVLGFVMMAVGIIYVAVLRTRLPPRKAGPLVEWTAFREPTFMLYIFGIFLTFWSLYFAFYYVSLCCYTNPHLCLSYVTDSIGWCIWSRHHRR